MALGCLGFAAFSAGIDWIFKGEDPRDRMVKGSIEDVIFSSLSSSSSYLYFILFFYFILCNIYLIFFIFLF